MLCKQRKTQNSAHNRQFHRGFSIEGLVLIVIIIAIIAIIIFARGAAVTDSL